MATPNNAPVQRLVSNVENYVKTHPQDAKGYYTLGRIHYLAFTLRAKRLDYYKGDGLESPYNEFRPGRPVKAHAAPKHLDSQGTIHLAEALRLLKKALELDPGNGLYELGLACVYEDGQPAEGRAEWREQAIDHYLTAYRKSMEEDQKLSGTPIGGFEALVSYEAGVSYLRLIKKRGMTDSEDDGASLIEKHIAALERLPMTISPIVLSLRPVAALKDLLAPAARVSFDLDGTGRAQSYSWLQPDTAFLVWDPEVTGRVTSGRQLFGNVTWWMFWESGYQALAALDDDHDGWVEGRELVGLALWFDRNQNGISDPGEVIPIEQAGVEALAARADGWDGLSPMNSSGVRLKDGRVLPTWDWIATSLASR